MIAATIAKRTTTTLATITRMKTTGTWANLRRLQRSHPRTAFIACGIIDSNGFTPKRKFNEEKEKKSTRQAAKPARYTSSSWN